MKDFITVHRSKGGSEILVNVDKIITIEPSKKGGSIIYFLKSDYANGFAHVTEGYDELKQKLLSL